MRRHALNLEQYDSDKITNRFLDRYDEFFEPWCEQEVTLLELGVHRGGSILLWRDYFAKGAIVGLDIKLPEGFDHEERIKLYEGSQADTNFLKQVAEETAPDGYDIIIDDASHIGELTKTAFWFLFDHYLKPGGLYVIEDWGTGYWGDWPDGEILSPETYHQPAIQNGQKQPMPGHNYGMVGFIKQLIDEQGAHDVSRQLFSGRPKRWSKFESLNITPSIVVVKKANR